MVNLKLRITTDMHLAMKAKDKQSTKALRMIMTAIKQVEVDTRTELDDKQVLIVVQKMLKQRKDSIAQFSSAGRDDLVEIEQAEVDIISKYMPKQMSAAEIEEHVTSAIGIIGATSMQDMGKLMGKLKPQLDGKADMAIVSKLIRSKLSS